MRPLQLSNGMHASAGDLLIETPPGEQFGVRLSQRFSVTSQTELDADIARRDAKFHARGIAYWAPADVRAAAFALEHPTFTVTGFAALALYGLPFFADACDTTLMSPTVRRTQPAAPLQPKLIRGEIPAGELWHVVVRGVEIPIAAPGLAVAQALKVVRRQANGWAVTGCGTEDSFVRAVQLVDASRRHLAIDPVSVLAASRRILDLRWVAEVLAASSALADSPKETEMRLIAARVAEKYGLVLQEQVPVMADDAAVTRLDLALVDEARGIKIGLMYDGAHHWEWQQRHKDARINIELAAQEWDVLRFASNTLGSMFALVDDLVARKLGLRPEPGGSMPHRPAPQG